MENRKGFYIVFEGVVGTGKTSQSKKLAEFLKPKFPNRLVVWTYEPGGTKISDTIRKVVQATKFDETMDPLCEAYLYAAARAQSLRTAVRPVLEKNGVVISDRSFVSSLAYQGFGQDLGVETVWEINRIALGDLEPDLVIYLNLDVAVGLSRTFDKEGDKFESHDLKFFNKIARAYKKIAQMPRFKGKWINVDARGEIDGVFNKILHKLVKHI